MKKVLSLALAIMVAFTFIPGIFGQTALAKSKAKKPSKVAGVKVLTNSVSKNNKTASIVLRWKNAKNAKKYQVYRLNQKKTWNKYKVVKKTAKNKKKYTKKNLYKVKKLKGKNKGKYQVYKYARKWVVAKIVKNKAKYTYKTGGKTKVSKLPVALITKLAVGKTYKFKVRAVNGKTYGKYSAIRSVKTKGYDKSDGISQPSPKTQIITKDGREVGKVTGENPTEVSKDYSFAEVIKNSLADTKDKRAYIDVTIDKENYVDLRTTSFNSKKIKFPKKAPSLEADANGNVKLTPDIRNFYVLELIRLSHIYCPSVKLTSINIDGEKTYVNFDIIFKQQYSEARGYYDDYTTYQLVYKKGKAYKGHLGIKEGDKLMIQYPYAYTDPEEREKGHYTYGDYALYTIGEKMPFVYSSTSKPQSIDTVIMDKKTYRTAACAIDPYELAVVNGKYHSDYASLKPRAPLIFTKTSLSYSVTDGYIGLKYDEKFLRREYKRIGLESKGITFEDYIERISKGMTPPKEVWDSLNPDGEYCNFY